MDGSRFDVWTRRRFGMAATGTAASAFGLMALDTAAKKKGKKKKKKKKKCKKVRCNNEFEICQRAAGENCCLGLNCDRIEGESSLRCCRGVRSSCEPGNSLCCGNLQCREGSVNGVVGNHCCINDPSPCSIDDDCCFGACISGECAAPSDRALKANFGSVDPVDMLSRVRNLPINTWNYTVDDPSIRHIGPMAQDFAATFGVGTDDRHIHPVDGQGVALAAIQGLARQLGELRAENARLTQRLAEIERVQSDA